MATETHPMPPFLAGIYVLSGVCLVAVVYAALWQYTGLVGVLALTEISAIVLIVCRDTVLGDIL